VRVVDGSYKCSRCGTDLPLEGGDRPHVVFVAVSGKPTVRVLTVHDVEVHRCEVREPRVEETLARGQPS
jgi:hypothetical protein